MFVWENENVSFSSFDKKKKYLFKVTLKFLNSQIANLYYFWKIGPKKSGNGPERTLDISGF